MDAPKCDNGCGDDATVQFEDVGLCDDCAAALIREVIKPILGKRCCSIWRQRSNGALAVCLEMSGVEHDH